MTLHSPARAERAFAVDGISVAAARRFTAHVAASWALRAEVIDDTVLVVSELVSIALRHARDQVVLALTRHDDHVTIEVTAERLNRPVGGMTDDGNEPRRAIIAAAPRRSAGCTGPS